MKKICFVSTIAGSLQAFLLDTAKALHETGKFDVSFMASPNAKVEKNFPDYIHFYAVPMKRGMSFDGLKVIAQMKKIFKEQQFDIVQYFTPNASFYASIAAKQAKVPVRIYTQWGLAYIGFSGLKRSIFKCIEKISCKNATWIEAENRANLDFAHKEKLYPEEKGTVILNGSAAGVSLERYDLARKAEWRALHRQERGISEDAFVFGFCGRQNKDKGINELFTAAKEILQENENAHLLMPGDSADAHTLDQELLAWAKNEPRVHLTGRVPNPEQYYAAMDCYVMPSYREGFGMTIIEASSMAVPVVASNIVGHQGTIIPDVTGLFVPSHDAASLRDAMKELMRDADRREEMGKQGRKYVEEFFEQKQLIAKIVETRQMLVGND